MEIQKGWMVLDSGALEPDPVGVEPIKKAFIAERFIINQVD